MRKSGLAFHCQHDALFEYVYDYDLRVGIIKRSKPASEQELRLRLFKLIPKNRLPAGLNKAGAEYMKASAEHEKAWAEYATQPEHGKAHAEYGKVQTKYRKARPEYNKALPEYEPFLIELHKELCPNCPFNGITIFTRKNEVNEWY